MSTLTGRLMVELTAELSGALDLASLRSQLPYKVQLDLANGSGAGQANKIFHDKRALAASATEDLDLSGTLTDPFGATLTFTKVRVLMIKAAAANVNNVLVGGASATQVSSLFADVADVLVVRPGGMFLVTAPDATGYAISATTDLLKIANSGSGTGVTYDIAVLGS